MFIYYSNLFLAPQLAAERIANRAVELYDAALRQEEEDEDNSDFPSNLNVLDSNVYKDADIPERLPTFKFSPYFKQVMSIMMETISTNFQVDSILGSCSCSSPKPRFF